jgi:hypothetical protein
MKCTNPFVLKGEGGGERSENEHKEEIEKWIQKWDK